MIIEKLEIKGLRGFSEEQTLHLGIPNGNPGSGLTILVGPNNSGKSTVIEAFRAISRDDAPSFSQGKRNQDAGDYVQITSFSGANVRTLVSDAPGTSECHFLHTGEWQKRIFILSSRRYFQPEFGKAFESKENYQTNEGYPATRQPTGSRFSNRLFTAFKNKAAFNKVLQLVLDPVPDWTIDMTDNGNYFLKIKQGVHSHTSDGLGEGLVSLFFIIDYLYDSMPNDLLVIDEPELSLHPSLQKRLMALLSDYAKDKQIVVATHSHYFIDFPAIVNGAQIARLFKENNKCQIKQLAKSTAQSLEGLLTDRNNPHVLGPNAKEVFFLEDRIILVEGQEDVMLYQKVENAVGVSLKGSFYGWGTGGAAKMGIIAQMLDDFGYNRVVGILDGDKTDEQKNLQTGFPGYSFYNLPAKDIRAKKVIPAKEATDGILDNDLKMQEQYATPVKELFEKINSSLNRADVVTP